MLSPRREIHGADDGVLVVGRHADVDRKVAHRDGVRDRLGAHVEEGDRVRDINGNVVLLLKDVVVYDSAGEETIFDGTPIEMKQMVHKKKKYTYKS